MRDFGCCLSHADAQTHYLTLMQTDAATDVRPNVQFRVWEKEDSVKATKPSERRGGFIKCYTDEMERGAEQTEQTAPRTGLRHGAYLLWFPDISLSIYPPVTFACILDVSLCFCLSSIYHHLLSFSHSHTRTHARTHTEEGRQAPSSHGGGGS